MRLLLIDPNSVRPAEQTKAAALAECGLEVTLFAPRRFKENYTWLHTRIPQNAPYRMVLGSMPGKPPNRCIFLSGRPEAMAGGVDAVLVLADENFWLTFQALIWQRLYYPEAIFLCHSWQNLDFTRRHFPQPVRALYELDTWMERRVFTRTAAIITRNREALGVLRRRGYNGRLKHIPWAVDVEHFRPLPAERKERPYTIGYVGRFIAEKGILDLAAASRIMETSHQAVLVGGGPLQNELEQAAGESEGRLQIRPVADHGNMPGVLNSFDVLVLPSRTGPYWKEQFGRTLAEAMACGIPVVGSSSGAIPDVVGDAGLIFPEGDQAGLARILDDLAEPSLRAKLGAAGLTRARERFSWQAWASQTLSLINEIKENHP
jgi:glycosyltransferase involved in cell wall biosynthesis